MSRSHNALEFRKFATLLVVVLVTLASAPSYAQVAPEGFTITQINATLQDPDGMAIAPDGRLFIAERIQGRLRVLQPDGTLLPEPFLTVSGPQDGQGNPERHRSAGLRGVTFDPDFANNRWVYIFYMQTDPRHNRVSRFRASIADPNVAETGSEQVLIELPFNDSATGSSGSHNGGALVFGSDGKLYITTGDGWNNNGIYPQGDPVQSLTSLSGKVLRINSDGTIPDDNPFFNQTTGVYQAIYALGLRNPYTASVHPQTGQIYINDVAFDNKGSIYELQAGGNYGWDGFGGIGTELSEWTNAGTLITGGTWYFGGMFPNDFTGSYLIAGWQDKLIRRVVSNTDPTVVDFITETNSGGQGPVNVNVGPDGALYYLTTDYQTPTGAVYRVTYALPSDVAAPSISPNGGGFVENVTVTLATTTPGATIYYTTDGSDPTEASMQYSSPFVLTASTTVRTRAYRDGLTPSPISEATFTRGTFDITAGLEAHWKFDDTGPTLVDSSPGATNAALLDVATRTSDGLKRGALSFDGDGDRADAGMLSMDGSALTICGWINADQFTHLSSRDGRIISKTTGSGEDEHEWMLSTIESGGETRLRFRVKTGINTTTLIADSGALQVGIWYHVAGTYDGAQMHLYLDGVEVGSANKSGAIPASNVDVAIGNNPASATGGDRSWSGRLDEVRLYNRALTSQELLYIRTVETTVINSVYWYVR
jgi:glucose/arabinose dehydrogenase